MPKRDIIKGYRQIVTLVVSAFKAGKWVALAAHPVWQGPDDVAPMVESLTFR